LREGGAYYPGAILDAATRPCNCSRAVYTRNVHGSLLCGILLVHFLCKLEPRGFCDDAAASRAGHQREEGREEGREGGRAGGRAGARLEFSAKREAPRNACAFLPCLHNERMEGERRPHKRQPRDS
jgi:hypothetical protein